MSDNTNSKARASVTQKRNGETISTQPVTTQSGMTVGAKTVDPNVMSLTEFLSKATALTATINGQQVVLDVKAFSTGGFGWNANGKLTMTVGDKTVRCQLGINLSVVKSKEAPR